MNIKKAAELSGIKADNIRYYEKIGLIPKIARKENGLRHFTDRDIHALQFVKHMRDAGLKIEPLTRYMKLVIENGDVEIRKEILRQQAAQLKLEIEEKQRAYNYLTYKLEHYDEVMNPIEENLENQEF
ncbi:MerR family transcriptional regulator [Lactococcus garvieae]|nr:MerR family transcriptional regulator [Lactococcus garvieae]